MDLSSCAIVALLSIFISGCGFCQINLHTGKFHKLMSTTANFSLLIPQIICLHDMTYDVTYDMIYDMTYDLTYDVTCNMTWHANDMVHDMTCKMTWLVTRHEMRNDMTWHMTWNDILHDVIYDMTYNMYTTRNTTWHTTWYMIWHMNTNAMIQVTMRDLGITFRSHSSGLTWLCHVTLVLALEINRRSKCFQSKIDTQQVF
jgi:hypothetical protein